MTQHATGYFAVLPSWWTGIRDSEGSWLAMVNNAVWDRLQYDAIMRLIRGSRCSTPG
jgi:hypothetical protein